MATAYTSLLGLALPVTGELSGTWGNTVNTEITSLLDSAISGTTTISADADITLTTTTGAANESREAIILWTAGGTTTRNITAPAQSKTYVVINSSSSTQSIVLRGAGPTTGVTIIKGEAAVCAWNGTDFIKVSNTSGPGTFTDLTVTGVASFADGTVALPSITNTGDTNTGIFFPAADTIAFAEGGVEAMRIDSSGNVGIGGTPTQKLDVSGGAGAAVSLVRAAAGQNAFFSVAGNGNAFLSTSFDLVQDSANLAQIAQRANAPLAFSTNNTERVRIDSSGNVGIGTSSPASKLSVGGNTPNAATIAGVAAAAGRSLALSDNTNSSLFVIHPTGLPVTFATDVGGSIAFATNGTVEAIRIDSGQNLLINTTAAFDNGKTNIAFDSGSNVGITLKQTNANNSGTFLNFAQSGTTIGNITGNATNAAYNTSSDYRLKEDIAPMTGALAKVAALKPVTYKWKINGSDGEGFIAHELAEVCPQAVTGAKDAVDADGKPVYQGIDVSFLVATLTAAIQEQQALITSLTARIAALESN